MAYGYYVHGPYRPAEGLRFNPNKLLLDPYAKDFVGELQLGRRALRLHGRPRGRRPLLRSRATARRSCPSAGSSSRRSPGATTAARTSRGTTWSSTRCTCAASPCAIPEIPEPLRGSYAALAPAPVDRLPEAPGRHDRRAAAGACLRQRPLPGREGPAQLLGLQHPRLLRARRCATRARRRSRSSRRWSRPCIRQGIEVILDVVYNHSCEGNQLGPTISFRGIDNAAYYILAEDPRYYADFTGCGNTLNLAPPARAADGDGFAALLGRGDARRRLPLRPRLGAGARARQGRPPGRLLRRHPPGPVLNRVKLIAEPWDLGDGGYQVGNFPLGWAEWNDRYRDGMRAYWKGDGGLIGEVAHAPHRLVRPLRALPASARTRASTSSPPTTASRCTTWSPTTTSTTRPTARTTATATINNLSWNCGAEGPTDDPAINALRERQKRNFLATLLLSQGVPMLVAGDEIRPHPARQQQRLLPGQRDQLARLGADRREARACSPSCGA